MREPGTASDRPEQPETPEGRVGQSGQQARTGWGGAPFDPPRPAASAAQPVESALEQTQPRPATPAPRLAALSSETDPAASGVRATGKRKRVTDSVRMPALRLNRRSRGPRVAAARPAMVYDTTRAPGYLRLARLGLGVGLLAAAWGATLLVISLAQALWMVTPSQPVLTDRLALYLLEAVGILWLALMALALIVVGAYSLFLALTRRQW